MSLLKECKARILVCPISPGLSGVLKKKTGEALLPNPTSPWRGAGIAFSGRSARVSYHNGTDGALRDAVRAAVEDANSALDAVRAAAEEFGSLFDGPITWWAHFYSALSYNLRHIDGDATNQSHKAFWRSENSFLFFERNGERVTTRLGPGYLVAVPMDLLNGTTKHGVWGSTHIGLQIRVKGNLNAEKWAPWADLFTAGWSKEEPKPFANALDFKASLGPDFAHFPLVVWGNPAAGGEAGGEVLHSRAYAQAIKGLEEDELCSVLLEQENGETRPCPRLARVVSDINQTRVCVCCRPKLGLGLQPSYDVDDDEMAMDDGVGVVADDGAAGAPQAGQSVRDDYNIRQTRSGKSFQVRVQFYGKQVHFGCHDTLDDARRERDRALKFRAKVNLGLQTRYQVRQAAAQAALDALGTSSTSYANHVLAKYGAPSSSSPDVAQPVHQPVHQTVQQPVQQTVWDWRAAARAAGGRQQPVCDWRAAARAAGGRYIGNIYDLSHPPPNN